MLCIEIKMSIASQSPSPKFTNDLTRDRPLSHLFRDPWYVLSGNVLVDIGADLSHGEEAKEKLKISLQRAKNYEQQF